MTADNAADDVRHDEGVLLTPTARLLAGNGSRTLATAAKKGNHTNVTPGRRR
jgi:hypothetical protein